MMKPHIFPVTNFKWTVQENIDIIYKIVLENIKIQGSVEEGITKDDFKLYKMNGDELESEEKWKKYQQPNKNPDEKMVYNFRFDMKNVIVLNLFGTKNHVFIKYDPVAIESKIKNLELLRKKI